MKRRNFCKSLIGAAVAAAIPGEAMRDILIHKGNPMTVDFETWLHDGTDFKFFPCARYPFHYQRDMLQQMNFYQAGSRIHMNVERGLGKTLAYEMNFSEIETRVIAYLEQKDKQQLKMLTDFEAAESWRDKIPKQKQA